ncbi:AAA family ATPase [Sulfurisphaera ohwakuensis]|uniref:Putative ABC-type ATPase n=1 Tax=Sulfurisphaera ohwakuensis TaxID=69656 RepID=A0A7J9RPH0_SULOH|nr:AAA family ATPase [Sulfurisphaera ohwakuensis]MBB5252625.1 putative ABC-type ATPase [Sulfurisphaera ohwakuensis]
MKLRIKSLGPISEESEIELGDLTVFFGPPNSGKSTVLRAIYYSLNTFGWELLSSKKLGYGLLNISYEIVDEKTVKLIFTPSDLLIRQSLPEGDFTFEPFSFIDFIKTHKVYERGIKGNVKFTSIVSPSECDEKVIKRLAEIGVNFEAEIIGNKGYARILTAIEGVSESCRDYLYHVIAEGIVEEIGKKFTLN